MRDSPPVFRRGRFNELEQFIKTGVVGARLARSIVPDRYFLPSSLQPPQFWLRQNVPSLSADRQAKTGGEFPNDLHIYYSTFYTNNINTHNHSTTDPHSDRLPTNISLAKQNRDA